MKRFKMFGIFMIVSTFILLLGSMTALAIEPVIEVIKPNGVLFSVDIDGNVNVQESGEQADMIVNESSKNDVGIFTTIPGNIGTATIRWINNGQIYWGLNPYNALNYVIFSGHIIISDVSTGSIAKVIGVSGSGIGSVSENEFFSGLTRGRTYIATLTGGGTCGIIRFDVGSDCHEVRYIY